MLRITLCLLSRKVKPKQTITACTEQKTAEHMRYHFSISLLFNHCLELLHDIFDKIWAKIQEKSIFS